MTRFLCKIIALLALILNTSTLLGDLFVYVMNYSDGTVSVIDTETSAVVATIPIGVSSRHISVSPDGQTVLAGNPTGGEVAVIDAASNTESSRFPTTSGSFGMDYTSDGAFVYVVQNPTDNVGVYETSGYTLVSTIPVGDNPFNITIAPNGQFAYVTDQTSDTVTVINTTNNTVTTTISGGGLDGPFEVVFRPDGAFAYVDNGVGGGLTVIDTSSHGIVTTVPVPNGASPRGIAILPDGSKVYVMTPGGGGYINIFDTATNTFSDSFAYPPSHDIVINSTGTLAYVSDILGDSINILDLSTNTQINSIPVGNSPREMAISPLPQTESVIGDIDITGKCDKDSFLTETEIFAKISWSTPKDGAIASRYFIYRNAQLIKTIAENDSRVFVDHNLKRKEHYTYVIIAENETGIIARGSFELKCN
ncbi:MAG: YncE family protein [Chlamydiia bacterium]|nr:YncE family protein [Chlamydiia bacterium]